MMRFRRRAGKLFGEDAAGFRDLFVETAVFHRITDVRAAPQNGEGLAACGKRPFVGVTVNAKSHAGDDLHAVRGQLHAELISDLFAVGRAHPRAYDAHRGKLVRGKRAKYIKTLGRVCHMKKPARESVGFFADIYKFIFHSFIRC